MGVTNMRIVLIATALLLPLASVPAQSFEADVSGAKAAAATADLSAQTKKPAKKMARKPKEKVEYMRAAPMK
jgi:uncharacterized protein YpuA (DUF1002 family)